ncbi:hypothetical protein [Anaerosolibacter sp.]|uniref:hypothetical protein n=1 Tax=Anaerosolibacter sp. TaxID=1872527 RepID=UPI0039EF7CE9
MTRAWGYRIMDNATAQEVIDRFTVLHAQYGSLKDALYELKTQILLDKMFPLKVLALAQIEYECQGAVSRETLKMTLAALNKELKQIHRWDNPIERKQYLLMFRDCLLGKYKEVS